MGAGEGGAQRRYLVPIHAPPHLRHEVGPARAAQRGEEVASRSKIPYLQNRKQNSCITSGWRATFPLHQNAPYVTKPAGRLSGE